MRHHGNTTRRAIVRIAFSAITIVGVVGVIGNAKPALAATTPPTYQHSWYIQTPTNAGMDQLASTDANWANAHCPASNGGIYMATILDFGQPTYTSSGGYSTYDLGGNFDSLTTILSLAEEYAHTWYLDTTSCPQLYLAIGVNNCYECPGGSPCGVQQFGAAWAQMVGNLQTKLVQTNWSSQETAWGASDLETEWDDWAITTQFLTGYTNYDASSSYHSLLFDFGDGNYGACNLQGCTPWTQQNVYDAAWGIGWDVPDPEIYFSGQVTEWSNIETNSSIRDAGVMQVFSVMTECEGPDTLPTGNCWVYRSGLCEYSPTAAWNALDGVVKSTSGKDITYATNIRYQNDGTVYGAC